MYCSEATIHGSTDGNHLLIHGKVNFSMISKYRMGNNYARYYQISVDEYE